MFGQTSKHCGHSLHPAAASPIEEKCFTQKTFPSLTSAPVAGCILSAFTLLWPKMHPPMYQGLSAKVAREGLEFSHFFSTSRVFQVFLQFLVINLGILVSCLNTYVPLGPSLCLHACSMGFFPSKNIFFPVPPAAKEAGSGSKETGL